MKDHSIPAPRSTFLADARKTTAAHYALQARLAALEAALAECVHYIGTTYGPEDDLPEPPCSIEAKRLLGWTLG